MMQRLFVCATIAIILGCSGNTDGKEEKAGETVFAPQIEALDKAKGVDRQIEDAAERQRQTIEEQGG
jgi:hypothetical protein